MFSVVSATESATSTKVSYEISKQQHSSRDRFHRQCLHNAEGDIKDSTKLYYIWKDLVGSFPMTHHSKVCKVATSQLSWRKPAVKFVRPPGALSSGTTAVVF